MKVHIKYGQRSNQKTKTLATLHNWQSIYWQFIQKKLGNVEDSRYAICEY